MNYYSINNNYTLSLVVPVYNEQEVINEFHRRVTNVLNKLAVDYEIIYINDGSRDYSRELLYKMRETDTHITIIDLSRNFGKEIAMSAGLDQSYGDAVVIIDADLQDPPELITELIAGWHEGYDNVYAVRSVRDGETALKKLTAYYFYRVIQSLSQIKIPSDTGDFRLLSRRAVIALNKLREQHRFMKGLFAWIGYPQKAIYYRREPRTMGKTKFNYWKLWNFAIEGFTSFSIAPLKISSYFGLMVAFSAFLYAMYIIYKTVMFGEKVAGYPSLMVAILFLGGVQLVAIGIMGEYLGRIFNEVKQRPLYLINQLDYSALALKTKNIN